MYSKAIVVLITTIVAGFVMSSSASAQTSGAHGPMIFDVRRTLPLEPDEPVFHDFYINAGPEAGFKKGQYITAVRPVTIQDPILNKQQAILDVTVGYLLVIQVQRGITVARLFGELLDEERPALEYESIMIGDRIDLESITTKAPKVKSREKAKPKSLFSQATAPVVSAPALSAQAAGQSNDQAANQSTAQTAAPPTVQSTSQASVQGATLDATPGHSLGSSAQSAAPMASPNGVSQAIASAASTIATSSGSPEKASPAAKSPAMVRVPVPTSGASNQ